MRQITEAETEELKQYFRDHWENYYWFKSANVIKEWLEMTLLPIDFNSISSSLLGEIKKLNKAGKIEKYNRRCWRVIRDR